MGVPALFRWLSTKYPKIISPVVETTGDIEYGKVPQYSDPNPNGELDNLYLDMNGIVHPCSHPEHKPAPATEDEMFLDVFKYTDRVLMMARPRKVLMIAVDGVAPRAKMNQQRSRRFRAAQDAKIANEEKERQIQESEARGETIDKAIKNKRSWDTNAITPGTPFMDGLAKALRYWVAYKLSSDPGWKDLQVIISDATVPGEGEHKLMSFIRSQRSDPEYDPNTKHCIYGLDADLIFLGLATHEPHFRVLREDVFAQNGGKLRVADQLSMTAEQKEALDKEDARKPFLWLHVNVLREYLEMELRQRMGAQWDLERAIDDWVFMCFFVGNDFLPHMPALSVRDNGIDILISCWKQVMSKSNDYITCDGKLNYEGVEKMLGLVARREDEILKKRHDQEQRYGNKRQRHQTHEGNKSKQQMHNVSKGKEKAPIIADVNMPLMDTSGNIVEGYAQLSNKDIANNQDIINKANMANADAAAALKKLLGKNSSNGDSSEDTASGESEAAVTEDASKSGTEAEEKLEDLDPDGTGDLVRTYQPGYRERYYRSKFGAKTTDEINEIRRKVTRSYLEGISWVLLYYYQGCPSWQWYYPFHYAPFAADFADLTDVVGETGIQFVRGEPFRPYEQLMSVLPAASGHTLPEVFRGLMSDPDSEIIDFYPENFEIDMNGAKMSWQGIALLPFIDETRLLAAVQAKYRLLSPEEVDRNTNKTAQLYISSENANYRRFMKAFGNEEDLEFRFQNSGLAGKVKPTESSVADGELIFPLKEGDMPNIKRSDFLQAWYDFPVTMPGKSMLLQGYIAHQKVLDENDKYHLHGNKRHNPRFQNVSNYVNKGPSGTECYMVFSMRPGGYRSMTHVMAGNKNGGNNGQINHNNGGIFNARGGPGGYGNQQHGGNGYKRNGQGFHNNYNNGQGNGYNSGRNNYNNHNNHNNQNNHNNGHNSYNNGGYNNGGYNNNGYNNNGYNNNGYNNNGYNNNHGGSYNRQGGNQGNGYNQYGRSSNGYANNRRF